MRHFVAYHKVAEWGEYAAPDPNSEFAHYSGHSRNKLEQSLGQIVWVISGERIARQMVYRLCAVYTPNRIESIEEGGYDVVGQGELITPPIVVTDESWFTNLKREQSNFSFGFSEIRNAEIIQYLSQVYEEQLTPIYVGEVTEDQEQLHEGTPRYRFATFYERNPLARARCIEHYGYNCWVCGFNFEQRYGNRGRNYIHVHHITPLSEIGEIHSVDPTLNLRPVCANCHAMLHRPGFEVGIDELRESLR